MSQVSQCAQCGAALSETTLDGLCPACAAGVVLGFITGSSAPASSPAEPGADSAGRHPTDFGEFELIEEIARGGMGVVYKARQKRLNRLVALKMILAGRFAGDEQVKRFRAEAEAAASLRHPNIVAIHDVGDVAGQHYFCMDLIEGPNLNGLVRDRPLSHLKAALLVQEVARAVQYAHERGVVHRDLKPSNIIIDSEGRPHVTDFGLAKRLGGDSDLTQSGQVLGSPNFAAPEQAAGRTHDVGPRSDVYSLGAILYYLLAGRPPFLAESIEQTLSMVAVNDPVPLRKLDPGVPRDLETICLKCLEKEPGKRYDTAGLLADELGRCVRGEPIQARPIGAPEKLLRWTRRNRTVAVLAGFAVMVLLLGAGGVFWQWRRAERSARDEHWQRTRAEDTVIELQWQRAEDLLSHGESAKGLVLLAGILRQSPTNRTIAERIVNVLTQRRFPLPVSPLLRHQGPILDAAFNADGTRAATASVDGTLSVWDAATGQRLAGPIAHGAAVNALRFSPDGTRIVTASEDGNVRFWKMDTGLQDGPSLQHSNAVVAVELSPAGELMLTTTRDRKVSLWRLDTGSLVFPSISHTSQVRAARFSPDGTQFLTASFYDGLVRVFEVDTGRVLYSNDFDAWITSARFSPDGRRIAVASYHQWASVWSPGGQPELVTVRHNGVVNDAAFSPDGQLFATISRDRRALVWDSRTGDLVFALPEHLTWVEEMAFRADGLALITREESDRVMVWDLLTSRPALEPVQFHSPLSLARLAPDGRTVLLGAIDGTAQIWNIAPAGVAPVILSNNRIALAVAFSPDGNRVVTGSTDNRAVVWDAARGTARPAFRHEEPVNAVAFSPDGTNILTASSDSTARVWNLETDKSIVVRHRQRVLSAEFSPDGRWFLTASFDGTARTWITETGERLSKGMRAGGRLWHAEFSPDGQWVATAAEDMVRQSEHQARVWNARSGEPVTAPLRHAEGVFRVSFHPSGRILATASRDGTAALWNLDSGARLLEVKHDGPVLFVDFSPDGAGILTASLDNTARIWDARTGKPLADTMRHAHELRFAAWSPDGRRVATACEDGSARVWDATTGKPITEFLWHLGPVASVQFSPDGGRLACAARPTHIWTLPSVSSRAPDWLPAIAEAVAGLQIFDAGSSNGAERPDLLELRKELTARPNAEPLIPWAKAFFGRGVLPAPESERAGDVPATVPGPNHLNPTAWAAVRELHRNPSNRVAWNRLYEQARREQDQANPFRHAQAEYFSRKTVTLGATNLQFWLERIRWLNQSNRHDLLPEAAREAARHFPDVPQFQSVK